MDANPALKAMSEIFQWQ